MGFDPVRKSNLLLSRSKELVVDFEMTESITQLNTVEVSASQHKGDVDNDMVTLSAKEFSVEETKRFPGSFNDPARMVSAFPGASTNAEGNNDIIVRGNSPKGILWRLEGIEIPNPNHFSNEGATGGPISILNSNMLDNSAFYTGAFSGQYGNATSGVFDISFRNGNSRKREYSIGIGVLGTDISAEGPFDKKGRHTYLVNYRYSSLALLSEAGIVDFGGVPKYQDAAFNMNFRLNNGGQVSFFGLGGLSHIIEEYHNEISPGEEVLESTSDFGASMGVIGINHIQPLSEKAFLRSSVSLSGYTGDYNEESLIDDSMQESEAFELKNNYLKAASSLHFKKNAKNKFETGVIATRSGYTMLNGYYDDRVELWREPLNDKGHSYFFQAYGTWQHRFNQRLTLNSGLHTLVFALNGSYSIEPRLGMQYRLNENQRLSVAAGLHSKIEPMSIYLVKLPDTQGNFMQPNEDLELGKSLHFVVGYENYLTENLQFKAEAYYQYLYQTPVGTGSHDWFSILNLNEGYVDFALVNDGLGRNYGVDLSLEKFFEDQYFFLVSGSLFQSEFKTPTVDWTKGRYAGGYTLNAIAGKDFILSDKDHVKRTLSISLKGSLLGGKRYTDILLEESIDKGYAVYDHDHPYSVKAADVFFVNLAATYRVDKKSVAHEFKVDIQNITNNQAPTNIYYDGDDQEIGYYYQLSMLPVISYKLYF